MSNAIDQAAISTEELMAVTLAELEDMDIFAFADFHDEEEADAPHGWRIADDGCAEWAVQRIAAERAELKRLKDLACNQIALIEERVAAAERRCENGTRFLTGKLEEYFRTVPHKATKTQETYRLLSGILKLKKGGVTMKQDEEKLVEYLKATGQTDYVKTVETSRWGDFKKRLEIVGEAVVDKETGEIVQGVELVSKPDAFMVDA